MSLTLDSIGSLGCPDTLVRIYTPVLVNDLVRIAPTVSDSQLDGLVCTDALVRPRGSLT